MFRIRQQWSGIIVLLGAILAMVLLLAFGSRARAAGPEGLTRVSLYGAAFGINPAPIRVWVTARPVLTVGDHYEFSTTNGDHVRVSGTVVIEENAQ